MQVEKVKNEIIKNFEDLNIGEAFHPSNYSSIDLYIKTFGFECEGFSEDKQENKYNAIKLTNGRPAWFSSSEKVKVPNCKIVVE